MLMSVDFFETQFQKQVTSGDLTLNPFEFAALPYLRGRLLDFGCGLGNLSVAAARLGCSVLALDASPTAINHLTSLATRDGLRIEALQVDLRQYEIVDDFDTVVSIGLLMFFDCDTARRQLTLLQSKVRSGGVAIINVLTVGTTFFDMFDPASYCIVEMRELITAFAGWEILRAFCDDFPAPGDTVKSFVTLIAKKPSSSQSDVGVAC